MNQILAHSLTSIQFSSFLLFIFYPCPSHASGSPALGQSGQPGAEAQGLSSETKYSALTQAGCTASVPSGHSNFVQIQLHRLASPTGRPTVVCWQGSGAHGDSSLSSVQSEPQDILSARLSAIGLTNAQVAPASPAPGASRCCPKPAGCSVKHTRTIFMTTEGCRVEGGDTVEVKGRPSPYFVCPYLLSFCSISIY